MKSFNHVNAKTVNEAVKLLNRFKGKTKLIAGGTDLLGILKDRILPDYPEIIINLKTIQGMDYIKKDAKGLRIGALTKLADIAQSSSVRGEYKVLTEAAEAVATPQIRNMGTLGGNLCQDVR
jgi:xanthine dehydrogenase YagS FAD-binding subunit